MRQIIGIKGESGTMKKLVTYIPAVAGVLLGFIFVSAGLVVLLNLAPTPPIPEGTPMAHFMAAFGPTGYLKFVKVMEVIGGVLVAIPRTRSLGLLILGPIIINIFAFHIFVSSPKDLLTVTHPLLVVLALILLWSRREQFGELLRSPRKLSGR